MSTLNLNVSFDDIQSENAVASGVEGSAGLPELSASCNTQDLDPDSCSIESPYLEPDIDDDPDGLGGH